jgi:hypothetical protein
VALGLGLLLIFLGIGDGSHLAMIQNAVRLGGGHVAVQADGDQELGGVDRCLSSQQMKAITAWLEGTIHPRCGRLRWSGLRATTRNCFSAGSWVSGRR